MIAAFACGTTDCPRHMVFTVNEARAYVIGELAIAVAMLQYSAAAGTLTFATAVSALPNATPTRGVTGAELALHPTLPVLYASTRGYNSIAVFSLGADGTPTRVENALTGGSEPRSFAVDPEGRFLYAANETAGEVVGFRVANDGTLTSIGRTVTVTRPAFVAIVLE